MKKVLHRSFKPAKCKIALQMAASRLKILKNKKDTQIKQLRRELAQLLESGQTQTAKIRVEHVLVEKLSVKAPDGPTKIKILTEIATQLNVTWEAESLVKSDPKETVLTSGASSCHSQSATLGFVLLEMVALKPLINVLYRCNDVKHIYKKEERVLNILCKVEKTHLDSQFYESDN